MLLNVFGSHARTAWLVILLSVVSSGTVLGAEGLDPIGVAVGSVTTCPRTGTGIAGTCYALSISGCRNAADTTATLKVTSPSGSSVGTIIFMSGGTGTQLYESTYTQGPNIIKTMVSAGFTTAQLIFTDPQTGTAGWLTGPGGPRALACRFATAVQWVYDNIHLAGTTKQFCATGQSGGSGALAYSLSEYSLGSILDMVELTGGPAFSRIDHGCICNQPPQPITCGTKSKVSECYGLSDAQSFLDPAFDGDIDPSGEVDSGDYCSLAVQTGSTAHQTLFTQNSIVGSKGALLSFPKTDVHVVLGGLDNSSVIPQSQDWTSVITALLNSKVTPVCVADDGHRIPNYADGATQIINDLKAYCVAHH